MALLDPVRSNAISKGVFGNSRFWLVVGGLAWLARAWRGVAPISRFSSTVRLGKTCRPSATWPMPISHTR